jgi:hypothetical protein
MSSPAAVRPRRLAQTLPCRRPPPRRRWWRPLPVILLLGLLAILRVSSQARLSELDWESRRLERLMVAESMRRGELLHARSMLTSHARLSTVAAQEGMVAPRSVKPIRVGMLPPPRIYWELPEETGPAGTLTGEQVGQAPPLPAQPSGGSL